MMDLIAEIGCIEIGICHDICFRQLAIVLYRAKGALLICYAGAFNTAQVKCHGSWFKEQVLLLCTGEVTEIGDIVAFDLNLDMCRWLIKMPRDRDSNLMDKETYPMKMLLICINWRIMKKGKNRTRIVWILLIKTRLHH
ncbi:conserved hypothetical protein [Ricinus communis]|uniref:Uncharacterized protein n=1 Tax=Ricinus communis TaxID=3988 RepID=B9S5S4_RICCO|nr:conserved hypothetical protein [Ricinus communis]